MGVKVVIKSKIYKDGTTPVLVSIIHKGKQFTKTLFNVKPLEFDKSKGKVLRSNKNYKVLNQRIAKELSDINNFILDKELRKEKFHPDQYFKPKSKQKTLYDIFHNQSIVAKKEERYRTAKRWTTNANKIKDFDFTISIIDIDIDWVKRFDAYMETEYNNKPNTRERTHRDVRRYAPTAYAEFKMPSNEVIKNKFTLEEISMLWHGKFTPRIKMAVDAWLFSVFNRGARVHDVLMMKHSHILNGVMSYKSAKGKGTFHEIELNEQSLQIIERYKTDSVYLFPYITKSEDNLKALLDHIESITSMMNIDIKKAVKQLEIEKKISMHIARHTFTGIADDSAIGMNKLQQLLGHANRATTETYVKSLKKQDELNKATKGLFNL